MGQGMPKAVTSVVVKRWGGNSGQAFRAGLAEMNGWRPSMEDAHVVVMRENGGFFGIFDGHGGTQCSAYVASRLKEVLDTKGLPEDDEAMKALALQLDAEFLDTKQASGSTGTFVIVHPPKEGAGQYRLRVGNIGDSRVLLGRADGTMVEGNGTDGGLTCDHKPDYPSERERIERTGGTVVEVMGVYRVNGDLAVSRAFGDAQYKQTGGPSAEDHPVTAAPEMCHHECGPTDFLILVCDGISESNFPNREVVKYAAEELQKSQADGGAVNPGAAAAAVCRKALERGSKDNLSCMIVMLGSGEVAGKELEFLPGAVDLLNHDGFRKAYEAMAAHAQLTLPQAVEARYDAIQEMVREGTEDVSELQPELRLFEDGPPDHLEGEKRTEWFAKWTQDRGAEPVAGQNNDLQNLLSNPDFLEAAQSRGILTARDVDYEPVVAAEETELRAAIEAHVALSWDERYLCVCGKEGAVLKRDDSDNTSQVKFMLEKPMTAWFPNETLRAPRAKIEKEAELRAALEAKNVEWEDEKHAALPEQEGVILKTNDNNGMSMLQVKDAQVWVPNAAFVKHDDGDAKRSRTQ